MDTPKYCFRSNNDIKPQKWISVPFMSVIDKIIDFRGRTPKKLGYDWSKTKTDYLALSALNVKQGYIEKNLESHYGTQELYNAWMKGNELKKGQILFTTEAPMGNVAQVPDEKPYILSQRTIAFNCSDIISNDFLAHLLRSPNVQKDLAALATGGTAKGVSQKSLNKLFVSIPNSRIEQQKIADFLSSYDEKISIQRERVEALERRKKGLLQKVFSQEIRFKADDGSEYPKWNEIPFCMAFSSISNNTLSRSELSFDVKTSVKNIHYGDVLIKYGAVIHTNIDNIPYVIEIDDKLTKEKLLKSGDVIFADTAEDNTVGKACELVLGDDSDNIVAGLHTIAVRPNETFAFGYLGYFFNSTLFHDQLLPLIQGIKVSSISKRALFSETKVFYPSLPEQRKIADFFTAIDNQINIEKERLATMETIKKGLLQGLFC